jgi:hypothetical protein
MPESVEGLVFQVVAQEMKDAGSKLYYNDRDTFLSDPLEAKAAYRITNVETYQTTDGFRAAFTVTNTGNAASSGEDTLNVKLRGPANLGDLYTDALYKEKISLAVDESKDFDIPVGIRSEMMEDYSFVTALISVQKETAEQSASGAELNSIRYLSNMVYADFDLAAPMDMELQDVSVKVDNSADIVFAMNLGDRFGNESGSVTYAVDDLTIARVENGKVVGVGSGETTIHATHTATGATVSATVTVSGSSTPDDSGRESSHKSDNTADAACDRGASCPMSAYSDLDKTAWYHDGVHWALENGVMTGFGNGIFAPDKATTRAQVVTTLWAMENKPSGRKAVTFEDVAEGAWYYEAVRWAADKGYVAGYSEREFGPDDLVTREQLATILYAYEKAKGNGFTGAWAFPLNYSDADAVADWAYEPMCWMTMKGIIAGMPNGTVAPKASATRAQVATLLMNLSNLDK